MTTQKISQVKHIEKQIDDFLHLLSRANEKRSLPKPKSDYTYIKDFFTRAVFDRNDRADVIDSNAYQEAVKIAKKLLPYPTSMEGCMDGRLFGPLVGLYGHIGETLPVAGGMFEEFVRNSEDQKLHLLKESNFEELIRRYFLKTTTSILVELIDSHLGCAARGAVEGAKGKSPTDNGLLADVLEKNEMKQAMTRYIEEYYGGKKTIIAMQISLDPHNGYMYMGLATEYALQYALKKGGYTQEVLDQLVTQGKIISTKDMAKEEKIVTLFKRYAFPIDIINHYDKAAIGIWKAVAAMKDIVLPMLTERLLKIHPQLKEKSKEKKLELQERGILLLVNAFTGYLHETQYAHYPFANHNEEGISLAKGTTPPYKVSLFGVSSLDMVNVPSNLALSTTIVRSNRLGKRVLVGSPTAPVGVIFQVKVMDTLTEIEWKHLAAIDWNSITEKSWETMTDETFFAFLGEKNPRLSLAVVNAVNKLRRRTAALFALTSGIAKQLLDQDIIMLPVLSDTSYRIRCVIPFLKTGY